MNDCIKHAVSTCLLFLLFVLCVNAQEKRPLMNSDITEMLKGGLPESTIILSIQQSPTKFDTSPAALIQLKKDGATQKVLDAIVTSGTPASAIDQVNNTYSESGTLTMPKPMPGETVGYLNASIIDGSEKKEMKWMPYTLRTASGKTHIPYVGPFMNAKVYAMFDGSHSELQTSNTSPKFEVTIMSGERPSSAVRIVKLEISKTTRKFQLSRTSKFSASTETRPRDIVPTTLEEIKASTTTGYTVYRLSVNTPLSKGEYAVVFNGSLFYDFAVIQML